MKPAQMPTDAEKLGARIRDARKAKGLSQAELAERVGLSVESISRAERGSITPTVWSLTRMADVLGVDLEALVRGGKAPKRSRRPAVERLIGVCTELDDEVVAAVGDLLRALAGNHRRPRPRA